MNTQATGINSAQAMLSKILLVDLENCPSQIHQLKSNLKEYSQVVICYASTGAKIPLDWLMPLNETINSSRLHIHKMDSVGRNAADFGIFFFAGMLAQKLSGPAEFTIVSDDTDLDHLVSLLENQGHKATREGKEKAMPVVVEPCVPVRDVAAGVKRYCEQLEAINGNKPASLQALRNSIRSRMAQNLAMTEAVLEQLMKLGAISVDGTKVAYKTDCIKKLAKMPA